MDNEAKQGEAAENSANIIELNENLFTLSPEAILIVSPEGKVLNCNSRVKDWLGYDTEEIIGKGLTKLPFLTLGAAKIIEFSFKKRISGQKIKPYQIECRAKDGSVFYGRISASIITDREGRPKYDLVMVSNNTEEFRARITENFYRNDLDLLSESATGFVELAPDSDIYKYIGQKLLSLVGDAFIIINNFNPQTQSTRMKGIFGVGETFEKITLKLLRPNPFETDFPLSKVARDNLISRKLTEVKDGLYEIGQGKFPKLVAKIAEKSVSITSVFTLGFSWKGQLFGNAVVLLRHHNQLRERSIEAFLHQASVALQRHQTELELRKAHAELEVRVEERTADLKEAMRDLEKFKLAVENASDLIVITDTDSNIIFANGAVTAMTGYTNQEVIGKTPMLWGSSEDPSHKKIWETIQKTRKYVTMEVNNIRKNGQAYIAETHVAPVLDAGMKVIFCVYIERDITKAKEVDQAKSEFVSLASHQLRTPLTSINWYTEAILNGDIGAINAQQKEYLSEVSSASHRMVTLVSSLLNVSRIDMGTFMIGPEATDLAEIAKSVVNEMKPKIMDQQIEVKENYAPLDKVMVDPNLTRIIFQNLISNAVKYTPKKGTVGISIKPNMDKTGKNVLIEVSDNGFGIPLKQQDKIFSKLFRADNIKDKVNEGTGLGLYIVKSILDHSDGQIRFTSKEGKGTTFYVTIPFAGMPKKSGSRELSISKY